MTKTAQPPRRSWMRYIITRGALKRLGCLALLILVALVASYFVMIRMPDTSYRGPLPARTEAQAEIAAELTTHVTALAMDIGLRNTSHPRGLAAAATYLERTLGEAAGTPVQRDEFDIRGIACSNLWIERPGTTQPDEIVVVGAHYDSCFQSPGANDNASGVAATLVLARRLAGASLDRTVRFVLFVNEEPPYFTHEGMGSLRYARCCRADGDDIVAMVSLETIGCYFDEPGSQKYPPPLGMLYPSTGNFIGFVGNVGSRRLVRTGIAAFRDAAAFPSEGAAVPAWLPGVGWSDHWSFWESGYHAIMVTDTAPFRYPQYHARTDTVDRIDFDRMSRVVEGLETVVRAFARAD